MAVLYGKAYLESQLCNFAGFVVPSVISIGPVTPETCAHHLCTVGVCAIAPCGAQPFLILANRLKGLWICTDWCC